MKTLRLVVCLVVATCSAPYQSLGQIQNQPALNIHTLVDSLTRSLNKHYIFPQQAQRMSQYLLDQLRNKAYASLANSPKELVKRLQTDLSTVHHDPHLFIDYNPAYTSDGPTSQSSTEPDMSQVKKYWQANNYLFKKVEILPGNIGYLPFSGFVPDLAGAQPTITAALQFMVHTNALIIDLRENMGGSPEMVSLLESYFFGEKTHMNDLINRSTNDTTVFYADPAKVQHLTLAMPIYILTSHRTFSGAEDFAYAMQMANRATIVGETTGGGAHPTKPIAVGQGIVVSIPFARSLNPVTHTDWEGTGVMPTVPVDASQALVKAQELCLRQQIHSAATPLAKNELEYLLDELATRGEPLAPPTSVLKTYTGNYGPLSIYMVRGKLYCKNIDANNLVTLLTYIAHTRFVLDDNAHIEFIMDSTNKCAKVKLYVSDGHIFEEPRKIVN